MRGREESRVLGVANQCQHQEWRVQSEFDVAESRPEDVVAKGLLSYLEKLLGEKNAMGGSSSDSSKTVNNNTSQQPANVFSRY